MKSNTILVALRLLWIPISSLILFRLLSKSATGPDSPASAANQPESVTFENVTCVR